MEKSGFSILFTRLDYVYTADRKFPQRRSLISVLEKQLLSLHWQEHATALFLCRCTQGKSELGSKGSVWPVCVRGLGKEVMNGEGQEPVSVKEAGDLIWGLVTWGLMGQRGLEKEQ